MHHERPGQATRFAGQQGSAGTIYKSFSATEQASRETRLLRAGEHELLGNVRFAPVIFQEYIPATVDLRITIVGEKVFAAEIHSQQTDYVYDFRMAMDRADIRPHELPDTLEKELLTLMDAFGLVYGAVDMRLTPDGQYVFLEVNPAGQWLFIEARTQQPITQALCDYMVDRDRGRTRNPPRGCSVGTDSGTRHACDRLAYYHEEYARPGGRSRTKGTP